MKRFFACLVGEFVIVLGVGGLSAQVRPAITGIAFVRVYASDIAASDAFYGRTLGYEKSVSGDGVARYGVNASQWIEVEATPKVEPESRLALVAFTTRDVVALRRYMKAHGVAIVTQDDVEFTVRDPEGNNIGFIQSGAMKGKIKL